MVIFHSYVSLPEGIIIFPTFDPHPSLHSHNWSHFRQPTVHTRHGGLPRASLVAAASCDQQMGFHRLSPSSREMVHLSWKNHWKTILELSCVRIHRNPEWCQHVSNPCPSSANHQSEVAAMVAANLDAVSAALESGDWPRDIWRWWTQHPNFNAALGLVQRYRQTADAWGSCCYLRAVDGSGCVNPVENDSLLVTIIPNWRRKKYLYKNDKDTTYYHIDQEKMFDANE